MKGTRRECNFIMERKAATRQRRARLRVQLACKGDGFIDNVWKKGYNQAREPAE